MSDHIPTFADVCSAIAEGQLAVAIDGGMYQVNALELRRYLNRFRSLPAMSIVFPDIPSDSSERTLPPINGLCGTRH